MRLIVNGIPLLSPRSGVGNYVYQNFKSMLALERQWDLSFYYGIQWSASLRDRPTEPYVKARKFIRRLRKSYPMYRATLDLLFGIGQWWRKDDLYHETNYVPMNYRGPTVLTVFDLSFHLFPETHPPERIRYMERYFYPRLERVMHFITISEAIKEEMVKHLNIPEKKITVTPLGVDDRFKPIPLYTTEQTLLRYGLKVGSYILYIGTLEPRKNIMNLIRAYARLPFSLRGRYPLILGGGTGWLMEKLDAEIARLGIKATTIKAGYIPAEDLPCLYRGAAFFIYPSLYEGFGLPPLEAMACGTPVITSSVSSLPEVVGNAGVLVHPEDFEKLAEEMQDLLTNPSRRQVLSAMGLERSKHFTWEKCAAKTLEVYDQVFQKK